MSKNTAEMFRRRIDCFGQLASLGIALLGLLHWGLPQKTLKIALKEMNSR